MSRPANTAVTMEEAKPALVPKLRFPEFRAAGGWEEIFLGNHCKISTGKLDANAMVADGQYRFYTCAKDYYLIDEYAFDTDALLISGNGANVGYIHHYNGKFNAYQRTYVMDQFSQDIFFIKYYLEKNLHKRIATEKKDGNTPYIVMSTLTDMVVMLPRNGEEQQRIAECLTSLDTLITTQSQKLEALRDYKKGLMQQLFPAEGETVPRLRFAEFRGAGEWEVSPLSKFILSLDAGVSVNSGDSPACGTEVGVLKTSAVTNGVFEPEENKVVFVDSEQSRLKEPVSAGTIIISRMNTPALVGANAYVESSHENLFLPDRLWAAKPRECVSMRFLAFILGSDKGRAALSKLAKGSSGSMKNITKPEVLAFAVMAPSPDEQERIASHLTSLDTLITAQTQKIEALKIHKKGLMQGLFPILEDLKL